MLPLLVVIPLAAAVLVSSVNRAPRRALDIVTVLAAFASAALSFYALSRMLTSGLIVYRIGGWPYPDGMSLVADGLTSFMLVLVNSIALLITLYSTEYADHYTNKWKYYALFMLMMTGFNGVLLSGDLFNIFLFMEIASVSAYALVSFECEGESFEATLKYAILGALSSLFILFAIALIYANTSSLSLVDIALNWRGSSGVYGLFVVLLLTAGFGFKAAVMPFHAWAPDAYTSAPAPVSAAFAGMSGKVLGLYVILRLFYNVFGASPVILNVFAGLGVLSMTLGVVLALHQWDLKRLLAYHSISQIGYMALGIGLGTPLGLLGALFHMLNHSVFKPLLFLNAGSVENAAGTRQLKELGGLGRKLPVTGATSMIASLSISGVPPFNGFWSKLIIVLACVQAGKYWYALAAVLASIITLASFVKVQRYAFAGYLKDKFLNVKEAGIRMKLPMIIFAALCVLLGLLLLPQMMDRYLGPAVNALLSGRAYAQLVVSELTR